jgi:hypothetical protein
MRSTMVYPKKKEEVSSICISWNKNRDLIHLSSRIQDPENKVQEKDGKKL